MENVEEIKSNIKKLETDIKINKKKMESTEARSKEFNRECETLKAKIAEIKSKNNIQ